VTSAPAPASRRTERWRALQAAAIFLVDQHGFAAVTVDDIATAAGTSRRTFFNHFPTKAAALFDPDPDDAGRLEELLQACRGQVHGPGSAWRALEDVCVSFIAGHEGVVAVRRRLVAERPELSAYQRTAHNHVESALHRWTSGQPSLDPFTAILLAQAAAAALSSAFQMWQPADEPGSLPTLVGRGFAMLSHGLT